MGEIKILVAQKDQVCLVLLEKLLSKWSFEVISSSSGCDALELYRSNQFSLVLTELKLPDMTGYELIERARGYDELTSNSSFTPFIAVTASAFRQDQTKCQEEGFNDFISMPFNHANLRMMIYYWLGNMWKFSQIQRGFKAPE